MAKDEAGLVMATAGMDRPVEEARVVKRTEIEEGKLPPAVRGLLSVNPCHACAAGLAGGLLTWP